MIYLVAIALTSLLIGGSAMASVSNGKFDQYDSIFKKYANQYRLDWKMLKRIAWIESRVGTYKSVAHGINNPEDIKGSVSFDGLSWGIMQTTLATSRDYEPTITEADLNNPDTSIRIGARHIRFLKDRYPQFNERDIVMSYNHGQGNQLKFKQAEENGTLKESQYLAGRDYWNKYNQAIKEVG